MHKQRILSWPYVGYGAPRQRSKRPIVLRVVDTLLDWQQRYRERRHLLAMSDHMLKDIGLSRADIEREAAKPFWQR